MINLIGKFTTEKVFPLYKMKTGSYSKNVTAVMKGEKYSYVGFQDFNVFTNDFVFIDRAIICFSSGAEFKFDIVKDGKFSKAEFK